MVKTAVILAAGLGSRLGERTKMMPKGFLEMDGTAIIERSVKNLFDAGIEKIYLGTGHISEAYDEFAQKYSGIECVKNENYAASGSMCTLHCFKDIVKDDFLILESDLLYDKNGIKTLLDYEAENAILASGKTNSNDEVYIEADENKKLINMGKDPSKLGSIYAELVGITKVTHPFYVQMCRAFEMIGNPKVEYETCLVGASKVMDIDVLKVEDYAWCEIDNEAHLVRAKEVYKRIKKAEGRK